MLDQYKIDTAKYYLKQFQDEIKLNDFSWMEELRYSDRSYVYAFLMENNVDILKRIDIIYSALFLNLDPDKFKNLVIPKNIKIVEEGAFHGCKIENIIFDNTKLSQLPAGVFRNCGTLKTIVLPKNLKILPIRCFSNCINLLKVELPDSLQLIGKDAFENCPEDLQIVANYRDVQKIKAPKSDIEFLKNHVVFTHNDVYEDDVF